MDTPKGKYRLKFNGRRRGAIGITCWITVVVEADSVEQAREKAYDEHEHIKGGIPGVIATLIPETDHAGDEGRDLRATGSDREQASRGAELDTYRNPEAL